MCKVNGEGMVASIEGHLPPLPVYFYEKKVKNKEIYQRLNSEKCILVF
jgi:hypothetical protein